MDTTLVIGILGFLAVLAVLFYVLKQLQQVRGELMMQSSQMQQAVSQRLDSNVGTMSNHLSIITGQITNTSNVVAQVEGRLGQMQEASRQIYELARQISSLKDILQSPKMRGNLGEFLLSDLLSRSLESSVYKMQYAFSSGNMVDAAIFLNQRILCVDSKFPLENFRKMLETGTDEDKKAFRKQFLSDVKKHVNSIADKYILPDENTFDFALMFIPAENVYYELIVRDDSELYEHCMNKKVIPVSPNTFYAYLQVILMGLRGFQISEQAKAILAQLQQLENDVSRFETDFAKIGSHLHDTVNSFERSEVRLQKLKKKLAAMGTSQSEPEPLPVAEDERGSGHGDTETQR